MKFSIIDSKTKGDLTCTIIKNTDSEIEISVETDGDNVGLNLKQRRNSDFIYLTTLKKVLNLEWFNKYLQFISHFANNSFEGIFLDTDLTEDLDSIKMDKFKELIKQFKVDFDKTPVMSLDQLTALYLPTFLEIFNQ